MKPRRQAAQSLIEFALLAPVLLLLGVAVWDGGSVLREQLIIQEAARAGARAAATAYGTLPASQVASAVRASGADLPLGVADPVVVDPVGGTVSVSHTHALYTPILRQLWGNGSGEVVLQAQARFFVPIPVPNTPLALPAPAAPCTFNLELPALDNNTGWFSAPFQLATRTQAGYFLGRILINWSLPGQSANIQLALFQGNPFLGQSNPLSHLAPGLVPGLLVTEKHGGPTNEVSIDAIGPLITPGSTYTVYFYNFGARLNAGSVGTITFLATPCP